MWIEFFCEKRRDDTKEVFQETTPERRKDMKADFNSVLLLIIAVEVGLIYIKLSRK
jgi:hypothetical protein